MERGGVLGGRDASACAQKIRQEVVQHAHRLLRPKTRLILHRLYLLVLGQRFVGASGVCGVDDGRGELRTP